MTLSTSAVAVCCSSNSLSSLRSPQLIEQPHVLDGDNGLFGEVHHQLDLLVGERPYVLPTDDENPNRNSFGGRQPKGGTHVANSARASTYIPVALKIVDVDNLAFEHHPPERRSRPGFRPE